MTWFGVSSSYSGINDGWETAEETHRPKMSKWDTLTPPGTNEDFKQGPCFGVNPACTGLKLCPPFNTRSSEGTIGTLDTALNRSRRSTIHCDKRGLCAGEVTWKRTDKTPFIIPPGKRHPRRALPCKLCFQMIMVGPKGRLNSSADKRIWIRYHKGWLFQWTLH